MHPARDPIHARTASPHLQVVLWLTVWTTTLTVDLINPLRALMVWAWVELLNTACFTTGTSMLNRDLCLVDIAIYNAHLRVRARLLARPRLPCCLRTRLAALGASWDQSLGRAMAQLRALSSSSVGPALRRQARPKLSSAGAPGSSVGAARTPWGWRPGHMGSDGQKFVHVGRL